MPRSVNGTIHKTKRTKVLKGTKGYWGKRGKLYRQAKDALAKALTYAYRDRKAKKQDFRRLWIARISAICRENNITYSRFINGLRKANILINRKALSNMAIEDRAAFLVLINKAKDAIK
jgi:large subunit ribosomal protein L20